MQHINTLFPEFDLKIRVDDEVTVYQNGKTVHDTFDIGGSQWNIVYDVELSHNLLVVKAYNIVSTYLIHSCSC